MTYKGLLRKWDVDRPTGQRESGRLKWSQVLGRLDYGLLGSSFSRRNPNLREVVVDLIVNV